MLDSHHHLWKYSPEEYPWIPPESALAKDHLIPELERSTSDAGITGTVAVQARQVIEENEFLLGLAGQTDLIRGVVGWVPLVDADVEDKLEKLSGLEKFVGIRHVLQDEPDDYFRRDDFHRGLSLLPSLNLKYDLLLFQRQIPAALDLVDRQPNLEIIIDHIAKPAVVTGRVESEWKQAMKELAKRDHVRGVKFSGLATEFPPGEIDLDTVRAYFEETLEIFGAERVSFGSDWPVCLLRLPSCADWATTVRELVSPLSPGEQAAILQENGERFYELQT